MPIREAVPGDAQILAEVHVASWKAAYRGLLPDSFLDGLTPESWLESWNSRLAEDQTKVLVWEDEGRISGFCCFGASRDHDADPQRYGEIYAIYLLPEAREKGKGAGLCMTAMEALRQRGFYEVTLWVLRQNTRAQTFYERMGFAPDGASKVKSKVGGIELDEVRFRRALR